MRSADLGAVRRVCLTVCFHSSLLLREALHMIHAINALSALPQGASGAESTPRWLTVRITRFIFSAVPHLLPYAESCTARVQNNSVTCRHARQLHLQTTFETGASILRNLQAASEGISASGCECNALAVANDYGAAESYVTGLVKAAFLKPSLARQLLLLHPGDAAHARPMLKPASMIPGCS